MAGIALGGEPIHPTELIFLGTGTSSSLPHVDCLTASPDEKPPCRACLSTLTPAGKKNIRRNTSAAIRTTGRDGRSVTIVIDAGKNFQAATLEWFPKYGLRKIDALLITHPHADGMVFFHRPGGHAELTASVYYVSIKPDRQTGWTLHGAIQPYIDIYLSQDSFNEIQRSFPYLVSKEFASGGGDVPEFKWHIISDKTPFEIGDTGITITPFSVQHGRVFSVAPPLPYLPTPLATMPSSPCREAAALPARQNDTLDMMEVDEKEPKIQPYMCFGFKIQDEIAYVSDVSLIPEDVMPLLKSLTVLVLDCLRLRRHTSHFGLEEAIKNARRIGAVRTYLTGFGHELCHEEYVTLGEIVGGVEKRREGLTDKERQGAEMIGEGKKIWLRPAHDGLRVLLDKRVVLDATY